VFKEYACHIHGACIRWESIEGVVKGCEGCPDSDTGITQMTVNQSIPSPGIRQTKWAYGVTTVPSRRETLLPRTLASLVKAGFSTPRLFVDGENNIGWWERNFPGHPITCRNPAIRTHGNWVLSLYEIYLRDPSADMYAMFQDDLVTYPNLKTYLERVPYPDKSYLNLYTFPKNQVAFPRIGQTSRFSEGWYLSNQRGLGAVALVFSRQAVTTLLSQAHLVDRVQNLERGWRAVDGGIVDSFRKAGWKEYVHNPSLVQHTGLVSSMRNRSHPLADSFRGEDFDALELLKD